MRSDQQQNNQRLIQAAALLFTRSEGSISLADVAKEANVSIATAYRHFESVDDILTTYRREIGHRFRDFSKAQKSGGFVLLEDVSAFWVKLVLDHGAALVHRRSHRGFLARYLQHEEYMSGQIEALDRPLREMTLLLGIDAVPGVHDEAAFLWNILFDPREIFDLHSTLDLSSDQISRRLVHAFRGALSGWTSAKQSE